MKETIIIIIALGICKCCQIIIDMIIDINKAIKWDKLKGEVFKFMKECKDSDGYILKNDFIGIEDECMLFYINFNLNEERKIKMLEFSTLAYSYGRKIEWGLIDNKQFVKISIN